MNITLYRYRMTGSKFEATVIDEQELERVQVALVKLPLQGEDVDRQFGVTHCNVEQNAIFGVFVQKFPIVITDYDASTKNEEVTRDIDTGKYFFVILPESYSVLLQAKRSKDLPSNDEICSRFVDFIHLANATNKLRFDGLEKVEDYIDREKIVKIFYEEADAVVEMELEGFSPDVINNQKMLRGGKRQKYFNPIEEYQEAAEAGALKFANNTEKVHLRAKQGESYSKDPIARAMLEGSANPKKIVYKKQDEIITQYGTVRSREVISIQDIYDDTEEVSINEILQQLRGEKSAKVKLPQKDNNQASLL